MDVFGQEEPKKCLLERFLLAESSSRVEIGHRITFTSGMRLTSKGLLGSTIGSRCLEF